MGRHPIWSHLTHRRNIYTAFIFPIAIPLKAHFRINSGEAGVTRDGVMKMRAFLALESLSSNAPQSSKTQKWCRNGGHWFLVSGWCLSFFFALFCSFSLITRERATHSLANSRYMLHGRTTNSHFVKFLQVGHIVVSICETVMWDISLSTGTIGTSIYTVYSRYNYLYTVYRRYNYLHCLQKV